ncbi:ATP-binding cassette domain-containing protein [Methylophilaceae bacterium]|mgnify:CR=1 FL=1|jgi:lipopolysaccharide transport system ATP-binding protein|nr:ATP-binding cassette domain-containing protein [Methylophilaceae bacterium]|tara:strand:+ start:50 stop:745 length:696 start_codon:yes stop_codon:yes gene_type:complete
MIQIKLKNVSLNFPIYSEVTRSFKKTLVKKIIGGNITQLKEHYHVEALSKINLQLKHGDRLGISGPNGSGKTTLLRVLSGILHPSDGEVKINGVLVPFIDLHYGLNIEASGLENIKMRCILLGMNFKDLDEIIEKIIDFSELGKYIYMPVKTYSSGMIMRLVFSILSMIKSDIIIMDEWLSVGDSDFLIKANKRLNKMIDDSSILVIASHSNELLDNICNKRIELVEGKIR